MFQDKTSAVQAQRSENYGTPRSQGLGRIRKWLPPTVIWTGVSHSPTESADSAESPHFGDQNLWVIVAHGGRWQCFLMLRTRCGWLVAWGELGWFFKFPRPSVIKPIRFEELVQLVKHGVIWLSHTGMSFLVGCTRSNFEVSSSILSLFYTLLL